MQSGKWMLVEGVWDCGVTLSPSLLGTGAESDRLTNRTGTEDFTLLARLG